MSREHGKDIDPFDHLRQSIGDIVTTPIGSRVYRREYGAALYTLIDRPVNGRLITEMIGAIATALDRWEPRLQVTKITLDVTGITDGRIEMDIEGIYLPNGEPIRLREVEANFRA